MLSVVQNAIERLPDKNAYEHAMWMYHYDLEEDVSDARKIP